MLNQVSDRQLSSDARSGKSALMLGAVNQWFSRSSFQSGFQGRASLPASTLISGSSIKFAASDSEVKLTSLKAPKLTLGAKNYYIGTKQTTSINQDPIISAYSKGKLLWSRSDYETTGADGRGYGLYSSSKGLYGVFSIDGTQGAVSQDFRRSSAGATQSWLKSYGSGGGAKAAVLVKLDPNTGALISSVYLSSVLSSGKTNSFAVSSLTTNAAGNIVVNGQSYFAPRRVDGKAMTQVNTTAKSPFNYTLEITSDLKTVLKTSAVGWK